MPKKVTIEIVMKGEDDEDDLDISSTLELIADQVASGFTSGFNHNDAERYHYSVDSTTEEV